MNISAFFIERPREMIAAPPRRCMKASTEPLKAALMARSALIVAVAYLALASAARPRCLTPAALASCANWTFHSSNPAALLPHEAAA